MNLDQAFEKVKANAEANLGPATVAVDNLGEQFQKVGTAANASIGEIEALNARIAELEGQVTALNERPLEMRNAEEQTSERAHQLGASAHTAAAEIGLLGEATGVTLPRHVRSFLGELPGVTWRARGRRTSRRWACRHVKTSRDHHERTLEAVTALLRSALTAAVVEAVYAEVDRRKKPAS